MHIRSFEREDIAQIVALFFDTVHTVNAKDYTVAQLQAWAPDDEQEEKLARWAESLSQHMTYVAIRGGELVGFSDLDTDGYLDRLYVHKDVQKQGVATALLSKLEQEARKLGLSEMRTDASITAVPFFERHGFCILQAQTVQRRGVDLVNYKMSKRL
ncbi:GNAT family N-acetyltransferase [Paenibacillus sp. chi10]|uniref:GNAT family N-acetyltransferase n=1 Tax=Paenibacillus suaedae TaxID=3077233 RepID=A0AAJ2JT06_9BACL|nr:GNAT family N-acetyltransferase [Paenibacillus sp. chi10]MDT8975124.1 GNAT family N-acetyltransferase [Paenibacillus sp. chi10]